MGKFVDLTGQRFGRLVVTGQGERTPTGIIRWKCVCDCGNTTLVCSGHLKAGAIKSCGCFRSETTTRRATKHNECRSRLYNIWMKMRCRCKNPNDIDWHLYGGKGIRVCREWDESFESFRDWALNNGYSKELSIDRINGNKNYCPENCRWATAKEQANNISRNHIINYQGKEMTLSEAADIAAVSYGTLKRRILCGWPAEPAIETPPIRKRRKMTF